MAQWPSLRVLLLFRGAACHSSSRHPSAAAARCNTGKALRRGNHVFQHVLRATYPCTVPRQSENCNFRQADEVSAPQTQQGKLSLKAGQLVGNWSKLCEEGQLSCIIDSLNFLVDIGISVGSSVFYHVLKRCMTEKDIVLGKRVHALTRKGGYDLDPFLANHIICMYSAHRKLEEAMQVFTKVAEPNTHMWASIILANAEHGQPRLALGLYRRMKCTKAQPNSYVFVAVLKACRNAVDLSFGKEVHADILASSVEPNIFVGSCLVDMYAKCNSLHDARTVFSRLPLRDVVMWNAMIAGYAQHGHGQEALDLFSEMEQEGVAPNEVTYVCLLKACAVTGALHQGKQLHFQLLKKGLESNVAVGSSLVGMYCKCGSLHDARSVFDKLPKRNVVTWTAMIAGYAQNGLGEEALRLYESVQQNGFSLANNVTFVCLLQACARLGALDNGRQLHAHILQKGLGIDLEIGNCLVDMYAKCGSLEDARRVFDELPSKDVVTWNTMITGYLQHGFGQEALSLHSIMQHDGVLVADSITFLCLLKACAILGALQKGKQLHAQIKGRGLEHEVFIGNGLVDMYAKCGSLELARNVFDSLQLKDVVTWNALMNGYAQHNDGRLAIQCFEEMQEQGCEPNDVTFICLLVACSHEALVHEGQRLFQLMKSRGITPALSHYNCMVDLLGRSGYLGAAEKMLRTMPCRTDAVGWTSLLSACKTHGDIKRGRRCFEELIALEPANGGAYVLMASLYMNAGMGADALRVEDLRKSAGAKKKPAVACIEVRNKVQEFTVGEERADIALKLISVNWMLREKGGHVPQTKLVLKAVSESEKENELCGHAEKLALAYGLMNTSDGTSLLVTKNLRMCMDCHSSTKILSRVEKREVIVRDAHRVHHFVDGSCSCGDMH